MNQTPEQSPYLPGTKIQFAWDSTSLGRLKTCPRLYYYEQLEGWSTRNDNIHLRFGIEYHQAMQNYEVLRAAGADHDFAVEETVRALLLRIADWEPDQISNAGRYKNPHSLVRSVIWYFEHFKNDPAKVVMLNGNKPAVELSFRFELDWGPTGDQPYVLCGHLDKVVEYNNDMFVMDFKTTTTTPGQHFFEGFQPSNQMTLYTLASQIILGSPVKGVIINAVQLLLKPEGYGTTAFQRGFTYRTPDQLEEWIEDLHYWFRLAQAYANANYWPMNDTACDKFGGCRFRSICSKSPAVRDNFLRSNFTQLPENERWNPLRSR
jgi:hypothetical protein